MKLDIAVDHRYDYHYVTMEFDSKEKAEAVLSVLKLADVNIQYENVNKQKKTVFKVCFKPTSINMHDWESTL